ncbi:uncharacterized protein HaLaN_20193 [Haematococcus lacustris]|uniref:Uncharacterized protein n=1 Tax=Haematococcus lacustris TaxID=44745 RepID=A0A699ZIW1_HAELA|nr:uncharacterized protein HaLaN_20193 [Haematococcus lacustris]
MFCIQAPQQLLPALLPQLEGNGSSGSSHDGALLAVGGGDRKVHLFDARTDAYLQAFPGHRDSITALAWREGSHTLASGSADRTVKLWSMDDRAYMDTLFGHQAELVP